MRAAHLVKRFVTSLWPLGPGAGDEAWVRGILSDREHRLWREMSRVDRRHAVGVARRVEASLGDAATSAVVAAALLHDVGKTAARLGTYGRVVATLAGLAAGRGMAEAWAARAGFTRRVGLYLRHDALGADLLAMAGSDPLAVAWAKEHHRSPEDWSVPAAVGAALKAADDD